MKLAALAGATATGCSEPAPRDLIPYVIPDENVVPGVPSFYAGLCTECPAGCGVVARVREGRVIKLEGNPLDPVSGGALCARGQAALQGLYNPDRLTAPQRRHADGKLEQISWEEALHTLAERARTAADNGLGRVAFIGSGSGPTLDRIVERWLESFGSDRLLRDVMLDEEPSRAAVKLCFGRDDLPVYRLDRAEVVLSFGANFLETWGSPVELTRQYAAFRTPRREGGAVTIGRSVYVGTRFGLTAAKCDDYLAVQPGGEAMVALAVLHTLVSRGLVKDNDTTVDLGAIKEFVAAYSAESVAERTGVPATKIHRMAEWFGGAAAGVALAGTADRTAHVAVAILNAVTGNLGKTVRFLEGGLPPSASRVEDVARLTDALGRRQIDVLVAAGGNPVFAMPPAKEAFAHVPFIVWCGLVPDETAALAHVLLPVHHSLESWSDLAPRAGVDLLGQPVMQPVVDSRPLGDILLEVRRIAGERPDKLPWPSTAAAVQETWRQIHSVRGNPKSFADFWQEVRQGGGVFDQAATARVSLLAAALTEPLEFEPASTERTTLVAFPHLLLYDGRGADKPWLQEIPEPVAQIVWDSWGEVHPLTAQRLGIAEGDLLELRTEVDRIEVPVHVTTQVAPEVVAVPIGQGHTAFGRYATGRGANPLKLIPLGKRSVAVAATRTGRKRALVSPLGVANMMGRPIVEATSIDDLALDAQPVATGLEAPEPYEMRVKHEYPDHQWGMTIDLNACTGCSACVAACYAENNIPVVGREEVARGHIMSWIRIERFVPDGSGPAPPLYLMPMLCQQCDHAPCEAVCPTAASYHTDEGLNGQVYNRCIGTRYCNNNCPYKVRRFNWFKPDWPEPLHLQLNPDVTARGAGVMEKCTFCVQRIRGAEMDARAEGHPVRDGEILPACAQACPARAITFGDMKDVESAMMRRRAEQPSRAYRALEELNTQPSIVYLRDVYRRRDEA